MFIQPKMLTHEEVEESSFGSDNAWYITDQPNQSELSGMRRSIRSNHTKRVEYHKVLLRYLPPELVDVIDLGLFHKDDFTLWTFGTFKYFEDGDVHAHVLAWWM